MVGRVGGGTAKSPLASAAEDACSTPCDWASAAWRACSIPPSLLCLLPRRSPLSLITSPIQIVLRNVLNNAVWHQVPHGSSRLYSLAAVRGRNCHGRNFYQ